jgi:MFS family permease
MVAEPLKSSDTRRNASKVTFRSRVFSIRGVAIMISITCVGNFAIGLISDFTPLYAEKVIGVSLIIIGLMATIQNLTSAFLSPILGKVSDRLGRKPFLIAGYSLFCVGIFIFYLAANASHLILACIIWGVATAVLAPSLYGYFADQTAPEVRGTVFGSLMASGGMVGGPSRIVGGLLWEKIGPRRTFLMSSILYASMPFLVLLLIKEPKKDFYSTRRGDSYPSLDREHAQVSPQSPSKLASRSLYLIQHAKKPKLAENFFYKPATRQEFKN